MLTDPVSIAVQDDDADLYDPDDPAMDWGQVVQEAAQVGAELLT